MSKTLTYTAQDVVDAIRLALAGAANNATAVARWPTPIVPKPIADAK